MGVLDKLATELIGDGKAPNLYFVTDSNPEGKGAGVIAVFTKEKLAVDFALDVLPGWALLIEDRQNGEVWMSPAWERMQVEEEDGETGASEAPAFTKGEPVIVRYQGVDRSGIVVRQKRDGIVTVNIGYDDMSGDDLWIDADPSAVRPAP